MTDVKAYLKLQEEYQDIISRGFTNFKKSAKDRITLVYCETRLESLEAAWSTFCFGHKQIISVTTREELVATNYYKNKVYETTEERYFDYKSVLKEAINKLKSVSSSNDRNENKGTDKICSVRLPKISIPVFSGNYCEWPSFRDLFKSLIHNNEQLDDVQKLHYLKGYLSGEAEQLLRHTPIIASNYIVCWKKLESRYDNKKYMCNQILHKLMGQRTLTVESAVAIKALLDNMTECLNALMNIGINTQDWDIIIIYIMSQKLDPISRKEWETKATESDELSTLEEFTQFLSHKFRSLEFLDTKKSRVNTSNRVVMHVMNEESASTSSSNSAVSKITTCQFCKENHKLSKCNMFLKENYDTRHKFVQSNGLCFNCLGMNHSVFACRQPIRCSVCKRKHNVLLHPDSDTTNEIGKSVENNVAVTNTTTTSEDPEDNQNQTNEVVTCFSSVRSQVLLATALVNIQSKTGNGVTLRCLLDQGSQASFITESAVQLLGLRKVPSKLSVSGIGGDNGSPVQSNSVVFIKLRSIHNAEFVIEVKVHVLSKLTTVLPSKRIVVNIWNELEQMELADPRFDVPNKVDLLLGAEIYGQILMDGVIRGPPGSPVAQKTKLGWILSGLINSGQSNDEENLQTFHTIGINRHEDEDSILKKFWELEAEPSILNSKKLLTEEEQMCEDLFQTTTTRDREGRYIVKLPFRTNDPACKYGGLKEIAARSLHRLEQRLSRNLELKKQYSQVMKEYIDLEHMEVVPHCQQEREGAVYLPHHAVVRNNKTTTKVRVVYNASQKGTNGMSLNDDLMVGPKLQPDLRHLVMRWRQYPICLSADIIKMYRQVKVSKEDADFQRILWRDEHGILQHYRMLRVTFGTASAPYLAVKTLQQLACDEGDKFPSASVRVKRDFYMDDLMTGCETEEEGQQVYAEMKELLKRGGFQLQKWISNSKDMLIETEEDNQDKKQGVEIQVEKDMEVSRKVLGLNWNNVEDNFEYSVQLPQLDTPVTKRKVVSDIARLFDPLGWISPIIITSKIFIQKIWIAGIDWDQALPPHLLQEWTHFRSELCKLTGYRIPRWIHMRRDGRRVDLQGFCDASNDAYAAVVYARAVDSDGKVYVSLIASKTKVAPIKQVSVPRLELCGAVLLAKLLAEVSEIMQIPKERVHAWTDSLIVLAWLSSHPGRWKTFIANRVSDIISLFDRSHWSHVRSGENPADIASRGVKPADFLNNTLWKEGPNWLSQENLNYSPPKNEETYDTQLEEKSKNVYAVIQKEEDEPFSKYSSLRKQVRVVAWCRRFYMLTHIKPKPDFPSWLTSTELREALNLCIIKCQHHYFEDEIKELSKGKTISQRSKLISFNPFIDNNGMLRIGGRLHNAEISENCKHPILIPRSSQLAKLIVNDAHEKTLHGGLQLMLTYIRAKYWIVDAKNLIKFHVRRCVPCLRYSASAKHPIMGQLPTSRVAPSRPFSHSGVDYAGPIAVRTTKGRGHHANKGYICLFICMATRAIHLEIVSDMSSEGFIAAFKRFVGRRGHCSDLFSDNGTNFVGAERELKSLLSDEKSSVAADIREWLAMNDTTFHRIPPHSPNLVDCGKLELNQ